MQVVVIPNFLISDSECQIIKNVAGFRVSEVFVAPLLKERGDCTGHLFYYLNCRTLSSGFWGFGEIGRAHV